MKRLRIKILANPYTLSRDTYKKRIGRIVRTMRVIKGIKDIFRIQWDTQVLETKKLKIYLIVKVNLSGNFEN